MTHADGKAVTTAADLAGAPAGPAAAKALAVRRGGETVRVPLAEGVSVKNRYVPPAKKP